METRSAKPMRPLLETGASRFMMLERAVEEEHRPHMLADLQRRVEALAETAQTHLPGCSRCGQPMRCQDTRPVSWWARFGQLRAEVSRYRCPACHWECRPPPTAELRESLQSLIRYYSENATRMQYDEYIRKGYGIGSGAVESAHKQVVHARLRQAGMRWSEAGARRLLALRLLLLNDDWALLDRMRMVSLA